MKFILPKIKDPRFIYLAEKAKENSFTVSEYDDSLPTESAVYVFPLNLREEEIPEILSKIPADSFVFLGRGSDSVKSLARQKNIHLTCLLEQESYLLKNAAHTAEGALAEIIAHVPRRLDDLCFLIYGYGNCGKFIARLLWICGAEVWIWSRERGQAQALRDGFNIYPAPDKGLGMFDAVINTVPDPIFAPDFLSTMQKDGFFFQIASGYSGIAPEEMKTMGIRFIPLHGLPGKYRPASEADAIWNEVKRCRAIQRRIL